MCKFDGFCVPILIFLRWSRISPPRGVALIVIRIAVLLLQHQRIEAFPKNLCPEFAGKALIKVLQTRCLAQVIDCNRCLVSQSCLLFLDTITCNSKPMKQNGKLEAPVEAARSPPRTTLLGTIFSPVFNFFSPATKTGKTKKLRYLSKNRNDLITGCD